MNFKSVFAKGFTVAAITAFLALNVQAQEPIKKDTSQLYHETDKKQKVDKVNKKIEKVDKKKDKADKKIDKKMQKVDKKIDKMKKDTM
ncbi:hypothetical protein [Chitinophaga filiformis]|uniref:Mitofilin n=1 Tax=Chitinophaga filiformis TaxID=104663 RepID=A0A1G7RM95_CHIFI|nr:hypothetical protein [Chitinophaga filiformis]SDG11872.1 mitofilin [Chitinophaga filiformis]